MFSIEEKQRPIPLISATDSSKFQFYICFRITVRERGHTNKAKPRLRSIFLCLDKFKKILVKVTHQVRQLILRCGLDVVQYIIESLLRVQVSHRICLKDAVPHRCAPYPHEVLEE